MTARKVPPTHPGVVLAEALDSMGLKIMPAAKLLGTSRSGLILRSRPTDGVSKERPDRDKKRGWERRLAATGIKKEARGGVFAGGHPRTPGATVTLCLTL